MAGAQPPIISTTQVLQLEKTTETTKPGTLQPIIQPTQLPQLPPAPTKSPTQEKEKTLEALKK